MLITHNIHKSLNWYASRNATGVFFQKCWLQFVIYAIIMWIAEFECVLLTITREVWIFSQSAILDANLWKWRKCCKQLPITNYMDIQSIFEHVSKFSPPRSPGRNLKCCFPPTLEIGDSNLFWYIDLQSFVLMYFILMFFILNYFYDYYYFAFSLLWRR